MACSLWSCIIQPLMLPMGLGLAPHTTCSKHTEPVWCVLYAMHEADQVQALYAQCEAGVGHALHMAHRSNLGCVLHTMHAPIQIRPTGQPQVPDTVHRATSAQAPHAAYALNQTHALEPLCAPNQPCPMRLIQHVGSEPVHAACGTRGWSQGMHRADLRSMLALVCRVGLQDQCDQWTSPVLFLQPTGLDVFDTPDLNYYTESSARE